MICKSIFDTVEAYKENLTAYKNVLLSNVPSADKRRFEELLSKLEMKFLRLFQEFGKQSLAVASHIAIHGIRILDERQRIKILELANCPNESISWQLFFGMIVTICFEVDNLDPLLRNLGKELTLEWIGCRRAAYACEEWDKERILFEIDKDLWILLGETNPSDDPAPAPFPCYAVKCSEEEFIDHRGEVLGNENGIENQNRYLRIASNLRDYLCTDFPPEDYIEEFSSKWKKYERQPGKRKRTAMRQSLIYIPKRTITVGMETGFRIRKSGSKAIGCKRTHWVRGHFRNQPCGKGGKNWKTIWIKPYIKGLGKPKRPVYRLSL